MGATTWIYYTDYTPDTGAALLRLQEDVFCHGQYQLPRQPELPNQEAIDRHLRHLEEKFDGYRKDLLDWAKIAKVDYTAETLTPEYLKQRYLRSIERHR